jgi:hypothetical protein
MRVLNLSVASVGLLAVSSLAAQSKPVAGAGRTTAAEFDAAAVPPTTFSVDTLPWPSVPGGVRPLTPSRFVARYATLGAKGEYETRDGYKLRSAKLLDLRSFAIALPLDTSSPCSAESTYDADAQEITILPSIFYSEEKGEGLELDCVRTELGSYVATNGFGAKTVVQKSRLRTLTVVPTVTFSGATDRMEHPLVVRAAPSEARALRASLRVVAVVNPAMNVEGDLFEAAVDYHEPTRSAPNDELNYISIVHADAILVVVYDARTRRILAQRPYAPLRINWRESMAGVDTLRKIAVPNLAPVTEPKVKWP